MIERPDLEISSLDPVVIKATVPVRPTIDLGSYRELRMEPEPVTVDQAEVERTIENLRRRYATIEPVERPVQEGDHVRVSIRGEVEGQQVLSDEDAELRVRPETLTTLPGVYERILGMSKDESAEFEAEMPEDYPRAELAGKPINYRLTVLDVKQENLPEPNDDFAKEVGEGFPSFAALRERIESDIRARAEEEEKRKLQERAVDALVAGTTIEFPPQLVEREVEHMMSEIARPAGSGDDRRALERHLQQAGRSEEDMREELRPAAIDRVKRTLTLIRLAEAEGIAVTPDDVEQELLRLAGDSPQAAQIRQIFDTPFGRETLERQLRNRRVMDRLTEIISGQAPPLPEPEATAAPAPEPEHEGSITAPETTEASPAPEPAEAPAAGPDEAPPPPLEHEGSITAPETTTEEPTAAETAAPPAGAESSEAAPSSPEPEPEGAITAPETTEAQPAPRTSTAPPPAHTGEAAGSSPEPEGAITAPETTGSPARPVSNPPGQSDSVRDEG